MLQENLISSTAFQEFLREVEQQLEQVSPNTSHVQTALEAEPRAIEDQCRGWIQSLSRSSLPDNVRRAIEQEYEQAQFRLKSISAELASLGARAGCQSAAIAPGAVAGALQQLSDVLSSQNPSAANLMLSQHIDGIYCGPDGQVRVRTCKLGALAGALDLVPRQARVESDAAFQNPDRGAVYAAEPRRRTRRDAGDAIEDEDLAARAGDFAADPHRFAGLGPEWFTEDVFHVPRKQSWAEENAEEVAEFRLQNHASMEATAQHFGKTVPTIRAALRYARELIGVDAFGKVVSQPSRPHWARDHAAEVAAFLREPCRTLKDALIHFGKSEPTIRKALNLAVQAGSAGENLHDSLPGSGASDESKDHDGASAA